MRAQTLSPVQICAETRGKRGERLPKISRGPEVGTSGEGMSRRATCDANTRDFHSIVCANGVAAQDLSGKFVGRAGHAKRLRSQSPCHRASWLLANAAIAIPIRQTHLHACMIAYKPPAPPLVRERRSSPQQADCQGSHHADKVIRSSLADVVAVSTSVVLLLYLYRWSECKLAAISASSRSPLARSFSLLYKSSSLVSIVYSTFCAAENTSKA